jgi:hypothetical protein
MVRAALLSEVMTMGTYAPRGERGVSIVPNFFVPPARLLELLRRRARSRERRDAIQA